MPGTGISFSGVLIRVVLALALVLITFNPSGYSLAHWMATPPVAVTPGKVLAALMAAIAWVVCLRTAFIALGKFGMLLGLVLFVALVWFLVDQRLLSLNGSGIVWAALVVVGVLLGIGLSWSLLRAEATGQIEVR